MAASVVLLVLLVPVILAKTTPERNIILECLSLFRCNWKVPVCGSNGTHCWHADSDCERVQFNCLQLFKKDFDKVDLRYCHHLTVGGIIPCCIDKACPQKHEPVCGQTIHKTLTKCKWFRNHCELQNANCSSGKDFIEVDKALCGFSFHSDEGHCTEPSTTKEDVPEDPSDVIEKQIK